MILALRTDTVASDIDDTLVDRLYRDLGKALDKRRPANADTAARRQVKSASTAVTRGAQKRPGRIRKPPIKRHDGD